VLAATQQEALNYPTGDVKLGVCRKCGYIGNQSFEPSKLQFVPGYSISLNYSPTYQQFVHQVATQLIDRYDLHNKDITEIGCGDGDFLKLLCKLGENSGVGFDPTSVHQDGTNGKNGKVRFIRDFYSEKYSNYPSDFICSRHVLQSVAYPSSPRLFLEMLQRMVSGKNGVALYFEVPNAAHILEKQAIWTIMYEYVSYFTPESLSRLFTLCGYEVLRVAPCFDEGQYLGIEAIPAREAKAHVESESNFSISQEIMDFANAYKRESSFWREELGKIKRSASRVVAWAAGSRAMSFLNGLQIRDEIPYVVDINPGRQNKYLPGTGQLVVPPEFLVDYRPDTVLITNPTFENEIKKQVNDLQLSCNFLVL
jgi:hypothetical protein